MNTLPTELYENICNYLNDKENLIFSTCTTVSKNFPYKINRRLHKLHISYPLIYPYLIPHDKNPLFGSVINLQDTFDELLTLDPIQKRNCTLSYISYFTQKILKDYNLNEFKYSRLNNLRFIKKSYPVKKLAYSYRSWGHPMDKSIISKQSDLKYIKLKICAVYNVKSPSSQLEKIKQSHVLKALVG